MDESDPEYQKRLEKEDRTRRSLQVKRPSRLVFLGIPGLVGGVLAVLLGIPWFIVLGVLVLYALAILTMS